MAASALGRTRAAPGRSGDSPGRHQRCLWSNHYQIRSMLLAEGDQSLDILCRDGLELGDLGNASISRRTPEGAAVRGGGKRPAESMFAGASAHYQNLHPFQPSFPALSLRRGLVACSPGTMRETYTSIDRSGANLPELTVSEISGAIKRTLESAFDRVRVRGEISGFKRAVSATATGSEG